MVFLCGLFGLPVAHASLPHSLYHVRALANKEQHPPQPPAQLDYTVTIKRVTETRVSGLLINGLILATIPALPLLDTVPLPVVYGLFFFMGYSALINNPMIVRMTYALYEPALFPPTHLFRKVEPAYIHLYTGIQVFCLGCIWLVKKIDATAAYFPFVIIAMIPLRMYVLPLIFDDKAHVDVGDDTLSLDELKDRCLSFVERLQKRFDLEVTQPEALLGAAHYRHKLVRRNTHVKSTIQRQDVPFIERIRSFISQLQSPQGQHAVGKFQRQTVQVAKAMKEILNEDYLLPAEKAECQLLEQAFQRAYHFPPIMRLDVLDAHETHNDSQHEKKG